MKVNPKKAIVLDIQRIAKRLQVSSLGRSEYLQHGKFSEYKLYDNGMTWGKFCKLAGIKTKENQPVPDETYFKRLVEAVKVLGRYPLASERKKFGLNMSKGRYPTLTEFIKKAVELGHIKDLFEHDNRETEISSSAVESAELVKLIRTTLLKNGDDTKRPVPPIPLKTKRKKWKRTGLSGFPYAPQEEQGVLALFSILCSKRFLPWQILDLSSGKGIDAVCFDETKNREIRVELKHVLSKGSWNHPIEDLDCVVCWENRWKAFPKPVYELKSLIKHFSKI